MDRVDTSVSDLDLDLDIDLESGGTTSSEDVIKTRVLGCENPKNILGRLRSGFMSTGSLCESSNGGDSHSRDKLMISDEICVEDKERFGKFREEMMGYVHKTTSNEEKPEKQKSARPCKPPRPPKGPSLDASDMKLLKEITVLNLKRKRIERRRTLKKIKKEKASSWKSNLFAFLVTIVFFLVVIFQGLLGSRI